jgi:hypothetical protein
LSIEECLAARNTAYDLKSRLRTRIEAWENTSDQRISLGDDSFGDLLAHIVGLGRDEFAHVMATPKLAQERAQRGDFAENFMYVFNEAELRYEKTVIVVALQTRLPVLPWDGLTRLPLDAGLVDHQVEGLGVVETDPRRVVFARGTMRL